VISTDQPTRDHQATTTLLGWVHSWLRNIRTMLFAIAHIVTS